MKLYSTNDASSRTEFADAVFQAMPSDGGLYMPVVLEQMAEEFWAKLPNFSIADIGFEISKHLIAGSIPEVKLRAIVDDAINFEAPLVPLVETESASPSIQILELFHGPTMAFKDFGARFMAGVMNELLKAQGKRLIILVATSGDTGGAVANGFYGSEQIEVVILYPKGGVSDIQEAQLTTLGGNISALRVDGTFDDCQALVKQAFIDQELRDEVYISSANSINILRLIPQTFYYVEAYRQWLKLGYTSPPVFAVPSGNFGNLTAGLIAQRLGLPVHHFVAGTNINDTVTRYAQSGAYQPRVSVPTLSNAMDVGSPSNFSRMEDLFGSTWNKFKDHIYAASFTDEATEAEMNRVYRSTTSQSSDHESYILDPHTAVGTLALRQYQKQVADVPGIVLATAHPGKFQPDVERILGCKLNLPEAMEHVKRLSREVTDVANDYQTLRKYVLNRWHK